MESSEGTRPTPEPLPRIIGITGGIGSGKSEVAKYIAEIGYPVYNSDQAAKAVVQQDAQVRREITELLGPESFSGEEYNREFVREKIFENDDLRNALNAIIHPAVKRDFERWVQENADAEMVFKESALLFELGLYKDLSHTILVTAEENLRMKRVMLRDNKTYREVEVIMENQMPERDKRKKASFIIENNDTLEELQSRTLEVIRDLKAEL